MAERDFKRKRKTTHAKSQTRALQVVASQGPKQSTAFQAGRDNGLPYTAGPLYGLAATAQAPVMGTATLPHAERFSDLSRTDYVVEQENVIRLLRDPPRGHPLPPGMRRRMERRFGRSFNHVEVHRGPTAHRVSKELQAKALTHRNHIWLGARTSMHDHKVMAHELTHVVQQGHARPLSHRQAIGIKAVGRTAPRQASPVPASAPVSTPARQGAVQRFSVWGALRRVGGAVVSGARSVYRGAVAVAENVMEMGRDALLALARRVAPDFARLFERDGIRGFLRRMLARGLRTLFNGPIGALRRMFNLDGLGQRFRRVANWFITIGSQLARNDCSGITAAARRVGDFMSRTFEPVVERVRSISRSISEFFGSIWDAVGAPVMDLLRRIGGSIWESIRGFIRDVGAVIRRVRNALGGAWSRVKDWLGIGAEDGTEEGGGLWNWIKDKAVSLWNAIKRPLQPIMGPLRTVGSVLLLISPAGPVIAVIHAWPYLRQAFNWVREQWRDLNLVVRARRFWSETVLPAIREAAQRVGDALVNAADWLLEKLGRVASGVGRVTGRLTGGILAPLGRIIGFLSRQFQRLVNWARTGLRYVATNARSLFRRLMEFIRPILQVFQQLMLATLNPAAIPGIIMGTLWQILPRCLKGPIIDFILDLIIRFLRAIPPLPQLGILWPFIRAAMLGFFQRLRSFATDRKVNVSNTVARIISGQSLGFVLGYLRGIVLGLWDGIVGPFLAIRDLFQLPEMIRNFLRSLGVRLCDLMRVIRCFMGTLAGRAIGALDDLLEAAGDLLDNPGRIVEMIRCAIQAMLSAVEGVGAAIANRLMALFEGPEDRIGEALGRLVGSALLDAVLAYFTAGSSAALTVIRRIAGFLRTVGRNVMRVVRMVARLIPRFLGFIRRIGGMFRRAGSRAGGLLGRIGSFFRRIARWFSRLMRRVGRRFRRRRGRGGRRRRDRRLSRAERERRKRLVESILRSRLTRGIGKIRLRLLMLTLKLRYRIRTLRLRRLGRRRHNVVIRNSNGITIPAYEINITPAGGGRHRSRMREQGPGGPSRRAHAVIRHSATSKQSPAKAIKDAGYWPYRSSVESIGNAFRGLALRDIDRPNWVNANFLRYIPRGINRPRGSRTQQSRKSKVGRTQALLRYGGSRGTWHGGHLIANALGGPATQWNLVPMTAALNVRAYGAAEAWLRSEWNSLVPRSNRRRGRRARARASVNVRVSGYRNTYWVSKNRITQDLGIPEQRPGSGAAHVQIKGFVPSTVRMEVRFRGRGIQGRQFTRLRPGSSGYGFGRAEQALRTPAVSSENDVTMRISDVPAGTMPPTEATPREARQVLRNNRTVFNFRQWRP